MQRNITVNLSKIDILPYCQEKKFDPIFPHISIKYHGLHDGGTSAYRNRMSRNIVRMLRT